MPQSPHRAHQAIRWINLFFLLATLTVLAWGLAHQSEVPQVLGRYSRGYAVMLGGLGLVVMAQLWLLCCAGERLLNLAGNLYTLLISTLVVVLLTEVLLRVFNPWGMDFFHNLPYHMQGMVDHPQLGYVHPKSVSYELGKNHVTLNSKGLRDREVDYPKAAGEGRILTLGDSVTFGWGVSQGVTFSDRMEPLLEQRTGQPWEVINAGVNGYNTEQERIWLESEGLRYDPDIVILTYVANDTDEVFDPNETTWRRYPTWPDSLPEALGRLQRLSFLFQGTKMFTRLRPSPDAGEQPKDPTKRPSMIDKPRWPESRTALDGIAATLRERGIHFLVARESGRDPRFFAELEAAGIDSITLDTAWAQVPSDQARVSRVDPHPSALAHAEMAKAFVDELDQRGWLCSGVVHTSP
jgi:hypothetical protein